MLKENVYRKLKSVGNPKNTSIIQVLTLFGKVNRLRFLKVSIAIFTCIIIAIPSTIEYWNYTVFAYFCILLLFNLFSKTDGSQYI